MPSPHHHSITFISLLLIILFAGLFNLYNFAHNACPQKQTHNIFAKQFQIKFYENVLPKVLSSIWNIQAHEHIILPFFVLLLVKSICIQIQQIEFLIAHWPNKISICGTMLPKTNELLHPLGKIISYISIIIFVLIFNNSKSGDTEH